MSKPKKILLGISGCIAAYKSIELIRLMIKQGYEVKVVLTPNALNFVTSCTVQSISQNKAYLDEFELKDGWFPAHIDLAKWADLFVLAPASANTLAKAAAGFADNLLLTTLLACSCPVLFVPTMNDQMYANPLVQKNIERLQSIDRYELMPPDSGFLACLSEGQGRLPEPQAILNHLETLL